VISVPGISMELCGGTHAGNIAEIRGLKIVSEQGIALGVRRIEAVAGNAFIEYINARDAVVKQLSASLKVLSSSILILTVTTVCIRQLASYTYLLQDVSNRSCMLYCSLYYVKNIIQC
jgi:alanyl-tRNA synthetase